MTESHAPSLAELHGRGKSERDSQVHDHPGQDHSDSHGLVDLSVLRSRAGLRAVSLSLGILGLTALVQAAVFVASSAARSQRSVAGYPGER